MRCSDFYEKWKKDPNWCEKSPAAVNRIDHYLSLVDELEESGLTPAIIYKNFPERAARELLRIKDDASREVILANAIGMIKRGGKVSAADVKAWADLEPVKNDGEDRENSLPIGKEDIPEISVKTAPESFNSTRVNCLGWDEETTLCRSKGGLTCDIDTRIRAGCPIRHDGEPEADPPLEEIRKDKGIHPKTAVPLRKPAAPAPAEACSNAESDDETYPVTAKCKESGCFKLQFVRAGLHICAITGMRPENVNGIFPDGCHQKVRGSPDPSGMTVRDAPAVPTRIPSNSNLTVYRVEADRNDQAAIRQMVARHLVEDEQEAAQSCFEEGLNAIMDRIEAMVQKEAAEAEALGE